MKRDGAAKMAAKGFLVASTSAEADEVKRIQAMIKDSPDLINAMGPDVSGRPLHQDAAKGQLIVAQFLLANGADIEAKNLAWTITLLSISPLQPAIRRWSSFS